VQPLWELDDDDKTYTKKYARNQTRGATARRTLKGIEPRDRCHRQIRVQIVKKKCTCGLCLTGDYSNIPLGECHLSFSNIAKDCDELGIPSKKGVVGNWQHGQVKRILFGDQKSVTVTDPKIQPNSYDNSPVLWETIELTEDTKYALGEVGKSFHTTTLTTGMDVDAILTDLKRYIGNYHKNGVEVVITSLPKFPNEEV
jgi:hypothetical protein